MGKTKNNFIDDPPALDFVPHGMRTLARLCGERWPRQMPIELASAYCGLAGAPALLKVPSLRKLIYRFDEKDFIDRNDLDQWILELKEKGKA